MMDRNKWILAVFCGLMVLSALFSAISRQRKESPQSIAPIAVPESRFSPKQRPLDDDHNVAREFSNAIADAVEKVMCSVVVVRTEKTEDTWKTFNADPLGVFQMRALVPEQLAGEGSGVIIDEMGYVLTSWHVIDSAESISIVLNDGTKIMATEIGHDAATDLAVLKFEPKAPLCPPVEFGNSDAVRVGEVAIAIGSPFSLQSSVTVGHISQKGRRVKILPYEDFIQTDAAINEGNSGGPLIDVDGRLIGVNAAIKTDAETRGVGIAFAVPSNLAMRIAKSLIETGKHDWPWVGCFFQDVGTDYSKIFRGASVVISNVFRDSPAARRGLQPGTAVFAVDGIPVKDEYDVKRVIFNKAVGDSVKLRLLLDGEQQDVELRLEEYPGSLIY